MTDAVIIPVMADYTVTPGSVLASTGAVKATGVAGASITAGQALYQDTDGSMKLYDANGAAPSNVLKGIALHASLTGQPIMYVKSDPQFTPGFTVLTGDVVIGSAVVPGNLCPDADKASGWFVTTVGVGIGSNKIKMQIVSADAAKA